jgi:hypothetical protein
MEREHKRKREKRGRLAYLSPALHNSAQNVILEERREAHVVSTKAVTLRCVSSVKKSERDPNEIKKKERKRRRGEEESVVNFQNDGQLRSTMSPLLLLPVFLSLAPPAHPQHAQDETGRPRRVDEKKKAERSPSGCLEGVVGDGAKKTWVGNKTKKKEGRLLFGTHTHLRESKRTPSVW